MPGLSVSGFEFDRDDMVAVAEVNSILRDSGYKWMLGLANIVRQVIDPVCVRTAVVGSLRRRHHSPNDIDILAVLKNGISLNQVMPLLEEKLAKNGRVQKGEDLLEFIFEGVAVDLIFVERELWGMHLLNFTGSRKFNELWINRAGRRGHEVKNGTVCNAKVKRVGYSRRKVYVPVMRGKSEKEILAYLGLSDFENPRLRDFDQLILMRGGKPKLEKRGMLGFFSKFLGRA